MKKWIDGFENLYKIDKEGNVYSYRFNKVKILKKCLKDGYWCVNLYDENGKEKSFKISRLILETFYPIENKNMVCHHKDGNKANDNLSNLEWINFGRHSSNHNMRNKNAIKNKNNVY